jgi:tRNA dimethylallyltransferase
MRNLIPFIDLNAWRGDGLLSIVGPTGSGKTSAALSWVRAHSSSDLKHVLLVSIDAVAVWKGLDIGSAKPMGEERNNFDWCGLDIFEPGQAATVTGFVGSVEAQIRKALARKRPVICVGGSHFYERALLEGQAPGSASDAAFQKSLEALPNSELKKRLVTCDPRFADKIHENDRYRLCRFLDLAERQKITFSQLFQSQPSGLLKDFDLQIFRCALGANEDPEQLRPKMRARLQQMFAQGFVDEVKALIKRGYNAETPALQAVGYREVVQFLEGRLSEAEMFENILIAHMQLAKKQRTWIRGLMPGSGTRDQD